MSDDGDSFPFDLPGPVEPSSDLRQFAMAMWQMHVALVNEGFSEAQPLKLVGTVLASSIGGDE